MAVPTSAVVQTMVCFIRLHRTEHSTCFTNSRVALTVPARSIPQLKQQTAVCSGIHTETYSPRLCTNTIRQVSALESFIPSPKRKQTTQDSFKHRMENYTG